MSCQCAGEICSFLNYATLTLLSGDVGLVPELRRVPDKLDIHLNVGVAICLDKRKIIMIGLPAEHLME